MKLPELKIPNKTTMQGEQATNREVQDFINKHGLSSQEAADRLGVTLQSVRYWVKGERYPSVSMTKFIRLLNKYPQLIRDI